MKIFRDKVAVITGAASGIGRVLAERFATEGVRVVLADIEEPLLQAVERKLRQLGAQVLAVRTDVADPHSVQSLADATLDRFGAVHILCNNAGVWPVVGPVLGSSCFRLEMGARRQCVGCNQRTSYLQPNSA